VSAWTAYIRFVTWVGRSGAVAVSMNGQLRKLSAKFRIHDVNRDSKVNVGSRLGYC
jgi:hypothetical protein